MHHSGSICCFELICCLISRSDVVRYQQRGPRSTMVSHSLTWPLDQVTRTLRPSHCPRFPLVDSWEDLREALAELQVILGRRFKTKTSLIEFRITLLPFLLLCLHDFCSQTHQFSGLFHTLNQNHPSRSTFDAIVAHISVFHVMQPPQVYLQIEDEAQLVPQCLQNGVCQMLVFFVLSFLNPHLFQVIFFAGFLLITQSTRIQRSEIPMDLCLAKMQAN